MPHSRQVDLQSLLEHFLQWEPTTVEGESFHWWPIWILRKALLRLSRVLHTPKRSRVTPESSLFESISPDCPGLLVIPQVTLLLDLSIPGHHFSGIPQLVLVHFKT